MHKIGKSSIEHFTLSGCSQRLPPPHIIHKPILLTNLLHPSLEQRLPPPHVIHLEYPFAAGVDTSISKNYNLINLTRF